MPAYDFVCPHGHVTEHVCSMADVPPSITCHHEMEALDSALERDGRPVCGQDARRVFTPPAAIHFHGPGFYSTDVKGSQERRRRPNPGDDLPRFHDRDAARIARTL